MGFVRAPGVDRGDDFNRWVPVDRGSAVFDATFDLTTHAAQQHFVDACDLLRNKACAVEGCQDGRGMLTRQGGTVCFHIIRKLETMHD